MKGTYLRNTIMCTTLLAIVGGATAQHADKGETKLNLLYSYSLPIGSFKEELVRPGSPRGVAIEILHHVSNKIAVGAAFGYQDHYDKKPRTLYQLSDGSHLSGVVSNSIQTIPVMAKMAFFPTAGAPKASILPFIAAGAGINIVSFEQLVGSLGNGNEMNVNFAAQVGGGIRVPFGKEKANGFILGGNYNLMPNKNANGADLNNLSIQAGIHLRMRDDGPPSRRTRYYPADDRYRGRW